MRTWINAHPYKVLLSIVALFAVIGLLGAIFPSTDPEQAQAVAGKDSGGGISVVGDESYCAPNPYNAKISFLVALRNDGGSTDEIDLVPVRRYSDGTTNDSIIDTMTMTVDAGGTVQRFRADFDYNAERHSVLECSIRTQDGEPVPIPVRS